MLAPFRFPIVEPFAGGLEAHVWLLARSLRERGHEVSLFAAAGSDPAVADHIYRYPSSGTTVSGRRDISGDPALIADEHRAYLSALIALGGPLGDRFDVVHNNSLHYLPVALADRVRSAFLSTLHTPPIRLVELSMQAGFLQAGPQRRGRFVAVSRHTADAWADAGALMGAAGGPAVGVVHNGVDTERWRPGTGGGPLIWFGRIVPEKGAELAIAAARLAGQELELAGPVIDEKYFAATIAPLLGPDVRYLGHLCQQELAGVVGRAGAAVVTPRWNEPYGMVVAEALACGTPVAAFARGGIPEILSPQCGRLAGADDVDGLVRAIKVVVGLARHHARERAVAHCSLSSMVTAYEHIYGELADQFRLRTVDRERTDPAAVSA